MVLHEGFPTAALHWLVEQSATMGSRKDVQDIFYYLEFKGEGVSSSVEDWLLGLVRDAEAGQEA